MNYLHFRSRTSSSSSVVVIGYLVVGVLLWGSGTVWQGVRVATAAVTAAGRCYPDALAIPDDLALDDLGGDSQSRNSLGGSSGGIFSRSKRNDSGMGPGHHLIAGSGGGAGGVGGCMNGGMCRNGTCICRDGWQGSECQFCGGKVRLTDEMGSIHDGVGNYSIGVKCSWLIDARGFNPGHHHHLHHHGGGGGGGGHPPIRIHLEEFATECGWDHLYVYDGDSVESPLLAVFSGLMYRQNISIRRVPEVVAHSGSALLHFFSDDAYNMSGFNISYRINGCPTVDSALTCSGNGICKQGKCLCDLMYTGEACHLEKCPSDCSAALGQGVCRPELNACSCNAGFAGSDCAQVKAHGYWEVVQPDSSPPPGSASHGAAVWRDTLHIIGGESYGSGELLNTYDFNGNVWETVHVEGPNYPEMRYGASTVMYGDKIFVYGGVVEGQKGVCNELWAFDVNAKTWENIIVKTDNCTSNYGWCEPIRTAGHSATLVPGYDSSSSSSSGGGGGGGMAGKQKQQQQQYMVVIFGHSPQFGYLNAVQEYHFGTREWKIVDTHGFPVKGGYGHSASYDPLTEQIYVYGGIVSESESNQMLSSRLYGYDPAAKSWTLLTAASTAKFLHTATFMAAGLMLVFGGNTHNDTSHSFGAKCYSRELTAYDVLCDSWHVLRVPDSLRVDLARFGHAAVIFNRSLYVYGGFDGQMIADMIRYTPGTCHHYTRPDQCLSARPGLKCVWEVGTSSCVAVMDVLQRQQRDYLLSSDQDHYLTCPEESRITMTQRHLLDTERCTELADCQSCVSTSFECTYCGNGTCLKDKCRDTFEDNNSNNNNNDNNNSFGRRQSPIPSCQADPEPLCRQLHNCQACTANFLCRWDYEGSKCKSTPERVDIGLITDPSACSPVCAALTSCDNCTQGECIWCQNEQRCVDKNAYTASFPYGQCREWTTLSSKCRASAMTGQSQCGFYKTCAQCRDDPACGWCDDGSMTGLGQCLPGGDRGPQEEMECNGHRWHFTNCPHCQCNGHSTCPDGKTCVQPCHNLTTGNHCEKCKQGYWGNPVNGGACQKCECNGQAAHCNGESGKCYCSTKGLAGDHCEKCDATNHYHGDPSKGSCYYDLTIDYQFTFNLSKKDDRHFTQINFRNSPVKSDIDADFSIICSVPAKMNITVRSYGGVERPLIAAVNCSTFRHRFSKTEYAFGIDGNTTLTTFYVYVYDFHPPLWIQIAFSQYPKLNLQQFFITFSCCFILLLFMAACLWKIKQKYDMFRRRQRLFVEMEQMASRPFSQVMVDIENRELAELSPVENIVNVTKKRKKDAPSPIALEPCSGNRAAVLSLLVRLPTGGHQFTPPGQVTGLAVASALVTLGNPRRPSIDHQVHNPKESSKAKRKQSQHPDSCI